MKTVMDLHHTPRQVCVAGKGNMVYVQFSCPQFNGETLKELTNSKLKGHLLHCNCALLPRNVANCVRFVT